MPCSPYTCWCMSQCHCAAGRWQPGGVLQSSSHRPLFLPAIQWERPQTGELYEWENRSSKRPAGFVTDLQAWVASGCVVRCLPHLPGHPLTPGIGQGFCILQDPGLTAVGRLQVSPSRGRATVGQPREGKGHQAGLDAYLGAVPEKQQM